MISPSKAYFRQKIYSFLIELCSLVGLNLELEILKRNYVLLAFGALHYLLLRLSIFQGFIIYTSIWNIEHEFSNRKILQFM